jgi:translation initiation factor IF-2
MPQTVEAIAHSRAAKVPIIVAFELDQYRFRPVCEIAILATSDRLPEQAAKACYQSQLDFNYLEFSMLEKAQVEHIF